jgi:hypothetical protein
VKGRLLPGSIALRLLRAQSARLQPTLETVRAQIHANGHWIEHDEWRISTITTSRIEPVERPWREVEGSPPRYYKVSVECDGRFESLSPTLERAVEFVGVYRALIFELWAEYGWASWATKDRLNPAAGETTA